eukprot:TRINITY_DN568_c0_g1_i7.p1 TRINITY_DN568_c0_g1~~TRINITY_DN568_c0_g1_i7.p1  ORF type:complete len:145 (+),score=10.83 TRINITY_DN568_c0_g1_i7:66-500(+)
MCIRDSFRSEHHQVSYEMFPRDMFFLLFKDEEARRYSALYCALLSLFFSLDGFVKCVEDLIPDFIDGLVRIHDLQISSPFYSRKKQELVEHETTKQVYFSQQERTGSVFFLYSSIDYSILHFTFSSSSGRLIKGSPVTCKVFAS